MPNKKIAYLGPAGSFSEEAALLYATNDLERVPHSSLPDIFDSLRSKKMQYAVVPVENAIEGSVRPTLSGLLDVHARVIGEIAVPVIHCLVSAATSLKSIRMVTSHPQALAQCTPWLRQHVPHAKLIPATSTSDAAVQAAGTRGVAAVASMRAAYLNKLNLLGVDIASAANNSTRFFVLTTGRERAKQADASSFYSVIIDKPGSLVSLLMVFQKYKLNMIRIESRPLPHNVWQYGFFIDVAADLTSRVYAPVVQAIKAHSTDYKMFGSFQRDPLRVLSPERLLTRLATEFAANQKLVNGDMLAGKDLVTRLINARLTLMPSIALWKQQQGVAIQQLSRQKNIIDRRHSLLQALGMRDKHIIGPGGDYTQFVEALFAKAQRMQSGSISQLRHKVLRLAQITPYDRGALRYRIDTIDFNIDRLIVRLAVDKCQLLLRRLTKRLST